MLTISPKRISAMRRMLGHSVTLWRVGPLARRLILLLGLGAIIPLVVSMGLTVVSADRSQKAEIIRRQTEIANSTGLKITNMVETPRAQLTLMAKTGDFSTKEGRLAAVTGLFQAVEGIDRVFVIGPDGHELGRFDRYLLFGEEHLQDISDSPLFNVTQSGETYMENVSFSIFNEPGFVIGVPIRDARREARGALAARLNLKVMWDVLAQVDAGATGYAYVVDSDGRLIGHQDSSLVLGGFEVNNSETVAHLLNMGLGSNQASEVDHTLKGLQGEDVLFDHALIPGTGWYAFVETPIKEAYARTRASIQRSVAVVMLFLLGAGIFAVIVGQRFVKPILQLTETTAQLSDGDLSTPIEVRGTDEVGRLADSFRFMVDRLKSAFEALENNLSELKERESDLRTFNESLEVRVAERTQELARSEKTMQEMALFAQYNPAPVLRFDMEGRVLMANPAATEILQSGVVKGKPLPALVPGTERLDWAACVKNAEIFSHTTSIGNRHFQFVFRGVPDNGFGNVYGSDITERQEAEEALQRSEKEAKTIAEIGRIINSTLDIEAVLEGFVKEVTTLLPIDRISISNIDLKHATFTNLYVQGVDVPNRRSRDVKPLAGTQMEAAVHNRATHLLTSVDRDDVVAKFPGLAENFDAGLRSFLSVPLMSRDEVIGVLGLRSTKPDAYSDYELALAERVGDQITGAIANAQLHATVLLEASERAALAEIGRIIHSTLDIDEVFGRCAEQVRQLISFDRMIVNRVDTAAGTLVNLYESGGQISEWKPDEIRTYLNTPTEFIVQTRKGLLLGGETDDELVNRFPNQTASIAAGLRWLVAVPMFSKNEVIGSLHFRSRHQNAYSEQDLTMAEWVAAQIAGAITNSELYKERQEAEEALAKQAQELARSNEELGQFAYVASHDLQEPLRMVTSYTQLLAKRYQGQLDSDALEFIEYAVDGATRMQGLISALLDYSRVGSQGKEFKQIDSEVMFLGVTANLKVAIEEIGAVVTHDPLPVIIGDSSQLSRLFQNLVGNAIKYRGERTPEVHVSADRQYHVYFGL